MIQSKNKCVYMRRASFIIHPAAGSDLLTNNQGHGQDDGCFGMNLICSRLRQKELKCMPEVGPTKSVHVSASLRSPASAATVSERPLSQLQYKYSASFTAVPVLSMANMSALRSSSGSLPGRGFRCRERSEGGERGKFAWV